MPCVCSPFYKADAMCVQPILQGRCALACLCTGDVQYAQETAWRTNWGKLEGWEWEGFRGEKEWSCCGRLAWDTPASASVAATIPPPQPDPTTCHVVHVHCTLVLLCTPAPCASMHQASAGAVQVRSECSHATASAGQPWGRRGSRHNCVQDAARTPKHAVSPRHPQSGPYTDPDSDPNRLQTDPNWHHDIHTQDCVGRQRLVHNHELRSTWQVC